MTVQRILRYPEDEAPLRKQSVKVNHPLDPAITALANDLIETLAAHPGAGLAAPQIGVHYRVIVVRFGQDDKDRKEGEPPAMDPPLALINPEIVKAGLPATGFDGCLSIPNLITWNTIRPSVMTFRALTPDGKSIRRTVKGIDARLLHHEIDHLDGVLFLDRLPSMDDLYIVKQGEDGKSHLMPVNNPAAKPPPGAALAEVDKLKL